LQLVHDVTALEKRRRNLRHLSCLSAAPVDRAAASAASRREHEAVGGVPETYYVKSGDTHIAFQVIGDGPIDVVWAPGFVHHIDLVWEEPSAARYFTGLASFSRLVVMNNRGSGLSDPVSVLPTLEERMEDVLAVVNAAECDEPVVFGNADGAAMCTLLAATHPDRVSRLVLYSPMIKLLKTDDFPWGVDPELLDAYAQASGEHWGTGITLELIAPSASTDERLRKWWGRYERSSVTPAGVVANTRMDAQLDARAILPLVQAPTLVLNRTGDRVTSVGAARWVADQIPDARFVELPGDDHWPWLGDADSVLAEVREFVTGTREGEAPDRVLATVLFTDIVESTRKASELGDRRWRELLDTHDAAVHRQLERFRGRAVSTAGDGFLATFDGPARAIRCAAAIAEAVHELGIEVRAGVHTGEVERRGDDVGGIAVHIGARVGALGGPGEVVVSRTVVDLVAGSGLEFEDRGMHTLKGVPSEWQLYAVKA
jgi:class 3 adenylate cyclase